jgi:hypothetical protein
MTFEGFMHLRIMRGSTILLTLCLITGFFIAQTYPYYKIGEEGFFSITLMPPIIATAGPFCRLGRWFANSNFVERFSAVSARTRWLTFGIILTFLCSPTNFIVYGQMFTMLRPCGAPYYLPSAVHEALAWLSTHSSPDDVVMAHHETGPYVPRLAGTKTMAGHSQFTIDFDEKTQVIQRFYSGQTTSADREDIVKQYQVRFVFIAPYERKLGFNNDIPAKWELVYSREDVQIYKVYSAEKITMKKKLIFLFYRFFS